ncbi:hypothetical protein KIPB_007454 [Kipferlia bialata]|uniref:Uncharacterized protein n=1 Tax=Kipferlia bialata TaxID=797122 RepID=A0A9K3CYJ9_9EUKA|nr:hypothetical protein KIPB_007454 [Kipferlia bialata]|eukprot:g7454.t1
MRVRIDQGGRHLLTLQVPEEVPFHTHLSDLSGRISEAILTEGDGSSTDEASSDDSDIESSLGECQSVCAVARVLTHSFFLDHKAVDASTPIGLLADSAELGTLYLTVQTEVDQTESRIDVDVQTERESSHTPSGLIDFPAPPSVSLASLPPSFVMDPSAVIVSGEAVTALSADRRVVVTVVRGVVMQSVLVRTEGDDVLPTDHVVCVQDNEFRLFSLPASGDPYLLRICSTPSTTEGASVTWQSVDVSVSEEAGSILASATAGALGTDSDGTGVAVVRSGGSLSILRLDASDASVSVLCHIPTPISHGISRITRSGNRVLLSSSDGNEVTAISLSTGSTRECTVEGGIHSSCCVGTVVTGAHDTLHVCVRGGTSVCVASGVYEHCVRGHSLIWVRRKRKGAPKKSGRTPARRGERQDRSTPKYRGKSMLDSLDLRGLSHTPQLAVGANVLSPGPVFSWLDQGDSPAATITCTTSSGVIQISLARDFSLLGLFVYTPNAGWDTVMPLKQECVGRVVPPIGGRPLYLNGSVYACVLGQLVRVDVSTQCVVPVPLSLCAHPQLSQARDALVLRTPSGVKSYPIHTHVAGDRTVEHNPCRTMLGLLRGEAVVDGTAGAWKRHFRVGRTVWTSLEDRDTTVDLPNRVTVTSLPDLAELLAKGVGVGLDIFGTTDTMGMLQLGDCLTGRTLEDCTFSRCSLSSLNACTLSKCTFTGGSLKDAKMQACCLSECTLTSCDMDGCSMEDSVLTDVSIGDGCSLVESSFKRCTLNAVSMRDLSLKGCNMTAAVCRMLMIEGCDCGGAVLTSTDLTGCSLKGTSLEGADLSSANLSSADISDAVFDGSILTGARLVGTVGLSARQLVSAASVCEVVCTDMSFASWDLTGTDLSDADLSGVDLTSSTLASAKLSRTTLVGVQGLTDTHLRSVASVQGSNLSKLDLSGMDLSGIDLSGVDMSHVSLVDTDITGCNLTGAILHVGDIKGAKHTITTSLEVVTEQAATRRNGYRSAKRGTYVVLVPALEGFNGYVRSCSTVTNAVNGSLSFQNRSNYSGPVHVYIRRSGCDIIVSGPSGGDKGHRGTVACEPGHIGRVVFSAHAPPVVENPY